MPAESAFRDRPGASYELIETMRFEAGVFVRIDMHIARLSASASELGFHFDRDAAMSALASVGHGPPVQRVRLTLAQDGTVGVTGTAFTPQPADTVWRLAIAQTRLDSSDALLRHKTTRRALYEQARAEFAPDEAEEVLLLNERGEVSEGTITTLFADLGNGLLVTPPLSCGILAGVLRAGMLADSKAREAVILPQALETARAIYMGNSLRGLIKARLISPSR